MRKFLALMVVAFLLGFGILAFAAACAHAGQLKNTFTAPALEASVTGPDTCAAGTVGIVGTLSIRRRWTGQASGEDSLTSVLPGTACVMTAGVPTGTYTVTVDSHPSTGPYWSCPTTGTFVVKGKPAKITNLGEAMLEPKRLPALLAAKLRA